MDWWNKPPTACSHSPAKVKGHGVTSSDIWDARTAAAYDTDAADMFGDEVVGPAVDFLAELAGSGRALGFAVGTGRIATPTRAGNPGDWYRVVRRHGGSAAGEGGRSRPARRVGDMANHCPGEFSLVFLPWNGISNLKTQHEQVQCFRNAARHLAPRWPVCHRTLGAAFAPITARADGRPFDVSDEHIGFDTYDVIRQICVSHHYRRDGDGSIRYQSGEFRYIWPAECDLMAQLAGLGTGEPVRGLAGNPSPPTARSTYRCGVNRPRLAGCREMPPRRRGRPVGAA